MFPQPGAALRHTSGQPSSPEHEWHECSAAGPPGAPKASRSWSTGSCCWRPSPHSLKHDPPHALCDTWNSYVPRETSQEASP